MKKQKWFRTGVKFLFCLSICVAAFSTKALAAEDNTFTVTYKTNAGVEMGTLEYKVNEENTLPGTRELVEKFGAFITKAKEKGNVYVPNNGSLWYEDKEFTKPAVFPEGKEGENYTLYCKLTVGYMSAGSVSNRAEGASYADVGNTLPPYLGVISYSLTGRNDAYEGIKVIFEKKNAEDAWVEVPEEYYTDKTGSEWPNMIYFRSVSDSGKYRVKAVRYTATDNEGNVLYYVDAEDTPKDEYTVNISPAELSVTGITAQDRNCNGTNEVQLIGGELNGILYNDNVSFSLGTGTMEDAAAGSKKAVATNITLTGEDAGNYTLKQPENITVTISHAADNTGWHSDENEHWNTCICGVRINVQKHTDTAEEEGKLVKCTVCGYKKTVAEVSGTEVNTDSADGDNQINGTKYPKTGDDTDMTLWVSTTLAAGGVLAGIIACSRKRKYRK